MSKIRIAALCGALVMALPGLAQETPPATPPAEQEMPPSTAQQEKAKAEQQAREMVDNPDVHWTVKDRMELLMNAPYLRPREEWELMHLFRTLPANEERILMEAVTNAIRANAAEFWRQRATWDTTWRSRTVTTTENTVTGQTTTTVTTQSGVRPQQFGAAMAIGSGMSAIEAYELLERDLDAEDRTTLRLVWNQLDSWERDAFINIVRNSAAYYNFRVRQGF